MLTTTSQPFIYALVPLAGQFDPIYQRGIKVACDQTGAFSERNEKQIFIGDTLKKMNNQIKRAEIIIADVTGQSLDVFYGLGYAQALSKPLIIIAQSNADIPEDLRKYTYLIYDKNNVHKNKLQADLQDRIQYVLQTPTIEEKAQFPLDFFINGNQLREDRPVEINYELTNKHVVNGKTVFDLQIDLNNKSNAVFTRLHQIGIITPEIFNLENVKRQIIRLPNANRLHLLSLRDPVLPYSWETLEVSISSVQTLQQLKDHGHYRWTIRIFTEMGIIEFPVFLSLRKEKKEPIVNLYNPRERMKG